jgi:hypothetical protein
LGNPDAKFILTNADRLVTVTIRCVVSFGASDGLNDLLLAAKEDQHQDWREAVWCFERDGLLMAALRAAILLDPNARVLSFDGIYRRLERPEVRTALLQALENRHGPDDIPPTRAELIDDFRRAYSEIDFDAFRRLRQFRNRGIAHLPPEKMLKSVTLGELRALIAIISRLAVTLQHLCQVQSAFRSDMLGEYRELARQTFKP